MMHKKDYVAIAEAIRMAEHQQDGAGALTVAARALADHMERDNPRFERAVFLAACGIPYGLGR